MVDQRVAGINIDAGFLEDFHDPVVRQHALDLLLRIDQLLDLVAYAFGRMRLAAFG